MQIILGQVMQTILAPALRIAICIVLAGAFIALMVLVPGANPVSPPSSHAGLATPGTLWPPPSWQLRLGFGILAATLGGLAGGLIVSDQPARQEAPILGCFTVLAIVGVMRGQIDAPHATCLALLASAGAIALFRGLRALDVEPIEIQSSWGGLGDGLGGWQLSKPAVLLLAGSALAGAATLIVVNLPAAPRAGSPLLTDPAAGSTPAATAATPPAPAAAPHAPPPSAH